MIQLKTRSGSSDSDFETWKSSSIVQLLPSDFEYKNCVCKRVDTSGSFEAEFKVNIHSEREVKEWVKGYNKKNKADNGLWQEKVTKGEACEH